MTRRQNRAFTLVVFFLTLISAGWPAGAQENPSTSEKGPKMSFAIAIHGGAGRTSEDNDRLDEHRRVLEEALQAGIDRLSRGETSLDVVEAVVRILEDSDSFNAGRGAVFNAEGKHELDASIMDGRTRAAGAVGGVRTVRNPISLARLVMTETRHVLLVTDGAEQFADAMQQAHNVERVPNDWFSTPRRRQEWERLRKTNAGNAPLPDSQRIGTVGCVALDQHGNLAAATSTGGLTNKRFGRIGDSPVIGAGTFADNETCAVSCTGIGEDYIRNSVAYDVSARIAYGQATVEDAVRQILTGETHKVRGGIIAVDRTGRITMQFNTQGMARAAADSSGRREIHVAE
ncbi:MAG: isoaspartyl peptidase/L-asparaginase [Planctomycetaceae bacterium]|nr:isoaspartyl peptidase/L-asparaginase [Planctomycetaceae bacterium]